MKYIKPLISTVTAMYNETFEILFVFFFFFGIKKGHCYNLLNKIFTPYQFVKGNHG